MSMRGGVYDIVAAWIARVNSSGIAVGQLDPDSVGVGPTVSPAYRIYGLDSIKPAAGTKASVQWRSSSIPDGKVQVGLDGINDAEVTVTQWDDGLGPMINGGLVDTTSLSGMEWSAPNNMNPQPNTVCFCAIAKFNRFGNTKGTKYLHFLYPYCTISRDTVGSQQVSGNQTNPNNIVLRISPQPASKFPVGVAFGANQNWYGYQEFEFQGLADYPYFMDTWIADGTATTFDLTYKPKKSTVTGGKTDNWVTKNGTETAPTSISTSTGAVVVAAAGTAADIWNLFYPVAPNLLGT